MAKKDKDDKDQVFTIRTPDAGFRGERCGVRFFDGVATTDDADKARELADLGYAVEPAPADTKHGK